VHSRPGGSTAGRWALKRNNMETNKEKLLIILQSSKRTSSKVAAIHELGLIEKLNEQEIDEIVGLFEKETNEEVIREINKLLKQIRIIKILQNKRWYVRVIQDEYSRIKRLLLRFELAIYILLPILIVLRILFHSYISHIIIMFYLLALITIITFYKYWRCPACKNRLSHFGFYVDPLFFSGILYCPQCGSQLSK